MKRYKHWVERCAWLKRTRDNNEVLRRMTGRSLYCPYRWLGIRGQAGAPWRTEHRSSYHRPPYCSWWSWSSIHRVCQTCPSTLLYKDILMSPLVRLWEANVELRHSIMCLEAEDAEVTEFPQGKDPDISTKRNTCLWSPEKSEAS